MKKIINILLILVCIGTHAQKSVPDTSFQITFNHVEFSEVEEDRIISVASLRGTGTIQFIKRDSGYSIIVESAPYIEESFNFTLETKDPFPAINKKGLEYWQFNNWDKEFMVYCDDSYRWVYLYLESVRRYMEFKLL